MRRILIFTILALMIGYAIIIPQMISGVPSVSGGIHNVRDYGAVGDGRTDDTDAVMRALDACSNREVLYFPVGTYRVTEELNVPVPTIRILGDGMGSLIYQDSSDKHLFVLSDGGRDVIEDICLTSRASTDDKAVVLLQKRSRCRIENVWISGGYYGIHAIGCLGTKLYDIEYIHSNTFPHFDRPAEAYICIEEGYGYAVNHTRISNTFFQQGKYGILIKNSSEGGVYIDGGAIEGFQNASISMTGVIRFTITNVHCEGSQSNIHLKGCSNGSINEVYVGANRGIILENCDNVRIEGGYVRGFDEINCNNIVKNNLLLGDYSDSGLKENNKALSITGMRSHATAKPDYNNRFDGRRVPEQIVPITGNRPSVMTGNVFEISNPKITTISQFYDGWPGQQITVFFGDKKSRIDFTSPYLIANYRRIWSPDENDSLIATYREGRWHCIISDN